MNKLHLSCTILFVQPVVVEMTARERWDVRLVTPDDGCPQKTLECDPSVKTDDAKLIKTLSTLPSEILIARLATDTSVRGSDSKETAGPAPPSEYKLWMCECHHDKMDAPKKKKLANGRITITVDASWFQLLSNLRETGAGSAAFSLPEGGPVVDVTATSYGNGTFQFALTLR